MLVWRAPSSYDCDIVIHKTQYPSYYKIQHFPKEIEMLSYELEFQASHTKQFRLRIDTEPTIKHGKPVRKDIKYWRRKEKKFLYKVEQTIDRKIAMLLCYGYGIVEL